MTDDTTNPTPDAAIDWTAYPGLSSPHYTQIPDEFFDHIMPFLAPSESVVMLYVMRKTFGWKKVDDDISLSQLVRGVRRKDGTWADHGTGLAKSTVVKALRSLVDKGLLTTERNRSDERGDTATTYRVRMAEDQVSPPLPRVRKTNTGGPKNGHGGEGHRVRKTNTGGVRKLDTQETRLQETLTKKNVRPSEQKTEPTWQTHDPVKDRATLLRSRRKPDVPLLGEADPATVTAWHDLLAEWQSRHPHHR